MPHSPTLRRSTAPRATAPTLCRGVIDLAALAILAIALAFIVPGFFGIERYVITGGSMSGTFEVGAVVYARPVPVKDLQAGDIITYQPPPDADTTQLVTHRITHIETDPEHGRIFTTKGDANADDDPWQFQIDAPTQPRVIYAVDYLGWPMIWLADRTWRILLIGVPAAGIFLIAARDFIAALRRPAPAPAPPGQS